MADVRVVTGRRSRIPSTRVGVQVNVFGMARLISGINGQSMIHILLDALQPSYDQAYSRWPVWTGASRDSLSIEIVEVSEHRARAALLAGGEKLINDTRNRSRKDYAPYIEFNGTRTAPPGIIFDATYGRDTEIRSDIHGGIAALVREIASG